MAENNLKMNVAQFNQDVENNGGYVYTTNDKFSSRVAYLRQSRAIADSIRYFQNQKTDIRSVIDIGCGDGTDSSILRSEFPSVEYFAFDPAKTAVERAQLRSPTVKFFVANLLDAKTLPAEAIDVGYLHGVLHHISDPQKAVLNCALFAKRLIILEPNGWNPILKVIEKTSKYHRDHEEQSFSPNRVQKWCEQAGYKVVSRKFVGFIPFFFPTFPAKVINFFEPLLEKIPILAHIFSGTCVLICEKNQRS